MTSAALHYGADTRYLQLDQTSGALRFGPSRGRPDSDPVLSIFDGASAWSGFTNPTTITLPTYTQSLTGAAAKDARELAVVTTGLVPGDTLELVTADGEREEVFCEGIGSGVVKVRDPLRYAHTTGSTLQAFVCEAQIGSDIPTACLTARARRLRAEWTYSRDGVTYTEAQVFHVVNRAYWVDLSERDIEGRSAGVVQAASWSRIAKHVFAAQTWLEAACIGRGLWPDLIREPWLLSEVTIWDALILHEASQRAPDPVRMEHYTMRRDHALEVLWATGWYDTDDDLQRAGTTTVIDDDTTIEGVTSTDDAPAVRRSRIS